MTYRGPEVILSGPAGTGKSRACLEKLHMMMLATPGARGLIVRKTAESVTSTALVTWREHVAAEALEAGVLEFYGGSKEEAAQYRYTNGSRIMIGGMNKPTKIMSSEYDVIYVQEAIELNQGDWDALNSRLRNGRISFQQLMADTNPDLPTHWLKVRASAGKLLMLESRHTDNPRVYDDDGNVTEYGKTYLARLEDLTGVRRQRLYLGLWVAAESLTFEHYDPAVHLIDSFPIPDDWPRDWVVDFGFKHPFACTMWANAPDGELYCYRQLGGVGRTTQEWAGRILETAREHIDVDWPPPDPNMSVLDHQRPTVIDGRVVPPGTRPAKTACSDPEHWADPTAQHHYRWTEPEPEVIITDHDAGERAVLERYLFRGSELANKDVNVGRDRVEQRFKDQRLFIFRDSLTEQDETLREASQPTCLQEEIPGYQWDPVRDKPIKIRDDWCDTMRYEVMHRDGGQRPSVRF